MINLSALTETLNNILRRITRILPSSCVVCGRISDNTYNLCRGCEEDLPWLEQSCSVCGVELMAADVSDAGHTPSYRNTRVQTCGSCRLKPPPFTRCIGIFHYRSPVDKLLSGFKFHAKFAAGFALSNILARQMQDCYEAPSEIGYSPVLKPDLILPVPLHVNRLRLRGFNQALEISRVISRRCHIRVSNSALIRIRDTSPQTELSSAAARKANLSGAFAIGDSSQLVGVNSVALIDDVVTTMTTVTAIATVLRSHGIDHIEVWCLARASK